MKPYAVVLLVFTLLALILMQGFQCASSEFTGAKLKMTQKDYKGAKRLLETEVQKNPGNDEAWYLLGALCSEDQEYARMNEAFNSALKLSDKHATDIRTIRFNRWGVHLNNGVRALERATPESTAYFDQAIEEFSNSAGAWPDTSLTYRYLGYAYNNKATSAVGPEELKTGMTGDQVRAMIGPPTSISQKEHNGLLADVWFYHWAGTPLYFAEGVLTDWDKSKSLSTFDAAIWAFRTAWQKGKDTESLKRMARIYVFRGDKYKDAFEGDNAGALKSVRNLAGIRKTTGRNEVIAALGAPDNIRKGARGTKKETLVYTRYNLTLEMDDSKVVSKTFSPPYAPGIDSSKHHLAIGQYSEAISLLQEGKSALGEDTEVLSILLQAFVQSDRIKEAIAEYEQVTKANPDNKLNHYILGVLYRSASDYKGAVAEFQKAYQLDPGYSDALFDLGATYYNWGVEILRAADEKGEATQEHKEKFKEALPYIEKVSQEKPQDVQVWETLGTIYAQLGLQDKAVKAFDQADKLRSNK